MDTGMASSSTTQDLSIEYKRRHLRLLLHAHTCLKNGQQTTNINQNDHQTTSADLCTVPNCITMRTVLQHMEQCSNTQNCSFTNCVISRQLVFHWRDCKTSNCDLCGPAQTPTMKEWQKQMQPNDRNRLVERAVSAVLEILKENISSLSPIQQALIKKRAEEVEANAFNTATSKEAYYQYVAAWIHQFKTDYKQRQNLSEQQRQRSTTISLPMIEPTIVQGPSNSLDVISNDNGSANSITQIPMEVTKDTVTSDATSQLVFFSNNTNIHINNASNGQAGLQTLAINKQVSIATIEQNTNEASVTVSTESNRLPPIDASSKSLPKHPAVFSPEDIREKMAPKLQHLFDQEEGVWFRQPVTENIAPGYFDIIKCPMDFSTIFKKLDDRQYTTPFQFWEDMWLVFNNACTYNGKKHKVYRDSLKLADMFMKSVDQIMKDYGYCCGQQYKFSPTPIFCCGGNITSCMIRPDADYFVYTNVDQSRNNLSGDEYIYCENCFNSIRSKYISLGDDSTQTLIQVPKSKFHQAKNDHQEPESMIDCIVCARRFHNICVLYHEHIWPEGYVCKTCVQQYNIKRKDNRYLAHKLTTTDLANTLEKRVNTFIEKERDLGAGRVTIRVLAASDQICEVKPRFKKHFGSQIPDGYPYRTKAIFAFQEIDGIDVVLFGMHVQEYDSKCPSPNSKRVYISYLDSVHYFRPETKRTALYHEILIGYLEYAKQLGFVYAHIWACPPSEGDDYIFYCHPLNQRVPDTKRLQEWYKVMLNKAVEEGVIVNYKNIIEHCVDIGIDKKVTDMPYFEGDLWTITWEDLLEKCEVVEEFENDDMEHSLEPEEPTEASKKRKLGSDTMRTKRCKRVTNQPKIRRKNTIDKNDFISKAYATMKKHKESLFVVCLQNPMSNPATSTDTDPLIQCDLMESRDAFLSFARDKHCEFSSLRRAQYSTMALLIELHSQTADENLYTRTDIAHEHRMERSDENNETSTGNSEISVNTLQPNQLAVQQMLDIIRHAVQCQDDHCSLKNCGSCKRLFQHTKECTERPRKQCSLCVKFISPIWFHAKACTDQKCPLPYCLNLKKKIENQHAATMQADQKRVTALQQTNMETGSSALN